MGRARGGNALLEYKGGHEVGDGAFQRLSLDAAHSKVEVAASVAGTRLPNQTKPKKVGGVPFRGRGSLTTTKLDGGGLCAKH